MCGLRLLEPGYRKFAIAPRFIKGITWAELQYESVYGEIRIAWRCEKGVITVDVTVPANTTALLTLPEKSEIISLGSGSYRYEYATETRLEQPVSALLACAAEARPLYELILNTMNEAEEDT